ncbi:helix-turn-helix domain-containing protein [Lactobacillus intestinalis]|uniref:helix-turn-helix domain-containing protein n=1 Tax=Lactobacillus intestinalis TaxID=151781 RepID=UPI001F57A2DC|nr:helix-turn-helix transcriptional regulator [Lactobacillus intestinalis]
MNRIKELRQKNNLTLKELGQKIGMANNTLSRYETGKRKPKLETWQALANFFNVSIPYLQGIDEGIYDLKFPTKAEAIAFIHKIMKAQNIKLEDIQNESKNY